jgi:outer membrane protein assembly factor BamB
MRRFLRGWVFFGLVVALGGGLAVGSSVATGASSSTDWYTYGFDLHRSGENPTETTIGVSNASSLHLLWSTKLGGAINGEPIEAAGVVINGTSHNVVYVGDEHGHFAAIDEITGQILWEHSLPTITNRSCGDAPGGVFGIGGAALVDRLGNTVFIAAGDGAVHAFDLGTGNEQPGWPVTGVFNPTELTSYGGITPDAGFNSLYVQTASHCDHPPYQGALTKIDVGTASIVKVFKPAGKFDGGGIWGPGGASFDPATNQVFVATGNALTTPQSYRYSEHVVALDPNLKVIAANYPGLSGADVDFGATPILYQAPGCPQQLAAKNKSGVLVVYSQNAIGNGPTQRIQIASIHDFRFNGIPAYSAELHTLYIGDSSDSSPYHHGMVALTVGSNCQLSLAWNQTVGPSVTSASPPTVANGVVYYGDGIGNTEFAFNAATGQQLWTSGTTMQGPLYAAPIVVNGELLVASWAGDVYAFGP